MSRFVQMLLRPYWRMTRGLTLGAQGIVIDDRERVLMVRHGYRPGWHFPGGGVEWGETMRTAMRREVEEETGVIAEGEPKLHGIFTNFERFPGDHIAVFLVHEWKRPVVPASNMEIRETAFFARDALPDDVTPPARQRLTEVFDNAPVIETW